eukprot:gene4218-7555_t
MVLFGDKKHKLKDILKKIDYMEDDMCSNEMNTYYQCMKSNNYENLKCIGYYARLNVCWEKEKRQILKQRKEFSSLGYKFSKIAKIVNPKLRK